MYASLPNSLQPIFALAAEPSLSLDRTGGLLKVFQVEMGRLVYRRQLDVLCVLQSMEPSRQLLLESNTGIEDIRVGLS
jgi:hypothetical protein